MTADTLLPKDILSLSTKLAGMSTSSDSFGSPTSSATRFAGYDEAEHAMQKRRSLPSGLRDPHGALLRVCVLLASDPILIRKSRPSDVQPRRSR